MVLPLATVTMSAHFNHSSSLPNILTLCNNSNGKQQAHFFSCGRTPVNTYN